MEGGALQADVAVCGEHSPCSGQAATASGPGSQRPACPLPGRSAPPVGSQEVFRQEPGPVCSVGGGGFSGAEFAPFPYPLPPSSSGEGPALLWGFSVPLFCEPLAVSSGRLIFSLAIPQFKKAPSDCSQGLPAVFTLSNAALSSLFRPHLLVAGVGVWSTFLLGVAFRHVIWGPYLIFPPS